MRGKAQNRINRIIDFGITPAYAGKSEQSGLQCFISGDHPRLCGEKKWRERRMKLDKGSPPPMRGKDGAITVVWEYFRITPAYAGKSEALASNPDAQEDHPRLCGEKLRQPMRLPF